MVQTLKILLVAVGAFMFVGFLILALMTPMYAAGPFWAKCGIGLAMLFGGAVLHQLSKPLPRS